MKSIYSIKVERRTDRYSGIKNDPYAAIHLINIQGYPLISRTSLHIPLGILGYIRQLSANVISSRWLETPPARRLDLRSAQRRVSGDTASGPDIHYRGFLAVSWTYLLIRRGSRVDARWGRVGCWSGHGGAGMIRGNRLTTFLKSLLGPVTSHHQRQRSQYKGTEAETDHRADLWHKENIGCRRVLLHIVVRLIWRRRELWSLSFSLFPFRGFHNASI